MVRGHGGGDFRHRIKHRASLEQYSAGEGPGLGLTYNDRKVGIRPAEVGSGRETLIFFRWNVQWLVNRAEHW